MNLAAKLHYLADSLSTADEDTIRRLIEQLHTYADEIRQVEDSYWRLLDAWVKDKDRP